MILKIIGLVAASSEVILRPFKYSNVFYARARREATGGPPQELYSREAASIIESVDSISRDERDVP